MYEQQLKEIVDFSYYILSQKIAKGSIAIDNEASFQLQFAYILKSVGELFEFGKNDEFSIELENYLELSEKSIKSKSNQARVDILLTLGNQTNYNKCAIELKFFKKKNHREPNNRYDVFKDLSNLELYRENGIDLCYFILATDHKHYVSKKKYSKKTGDFDFRDGKTYKAGTKLIYDTKNPHGKPISLKNDYKFKWDSFNDIYFLKIEV